MQIMQNTFDTTQIRTGTSVYGSDGEKIGDVAGVADRYFVIEKGFLFTTDIYVPLSAVASADEDGITLSMTKDEVENNDWSSEPSDDDRDTAFADTSEDTYATGSNTTAQGDMLERREERLTVDKDVEQTGNVSVGKHVVEERQVGKTSVTDTAHVEDTVRREEFDIDENTRDTTRQNR